MKKLLSLSLICLLLLPQAAFAKRLMTVGFEWQSVTDGVEITTNYGEVIDTTIKNGGAASAELSGNITTLTAIGFDHGYQACSTCYLRWYVYIDNLTDGGQVSLFLDGYNTATNVFALDITNTSGTYTVVPYYNNFGGSLSSFTITPDTWHYVEVLYDTSQADGSEVYRVRVDGVEQAASTAMTWTTKTLNLVSQGSYNGSGGTVSDVAVYIDDMAVNNSSETGQTSYPGEGKVAILVPTGDGSSNCTSGAGDWANVNEIPPSDTATAGGTNICELDTTTSTAYFAMTDSSAAGIDSYDTISYVTPRVRVREETSGASNYGMNIVSASGGTATTSPLVDAGDTTPRTNPVSTTAFSLQYFGTTTDPTTNVAWTPTGTNSIDNLQLGVRTTDGTPDTWVTTAMVLVEYRDGTPPASGGAKVNSVIDDDI